MLGSLVYNEKVRNWSAQGLLLLLVAGTLSWLVANTTENLAARGIRTGWDFLWRPAGFPISESVLPYDPGDTFFWALVVGLGNTLFLSVILIVVATILGTLVGLARRSTNPLLSGVAGSFVTFARNTPVIVQLLFWYALATTALPGPRDAMNPLPGVFLSLRGVYVPRLAIENPAVFWPVVGVLTATTVALLVFARRRLTGRAQLATLLAVVAAVPLTLAIAGVGLDLPELRGLNYRGGFRLSAEFAALMLGLVIYTSAFIGEIVRGGIDAVSRGQWEAGRALGLSERQTLRRIVAPQALRIIIPPLTSQYVSAAKNTTLALAVGFPELGLVVGTVINQTGQAIESILVLLLSFLGISLLISGVMNWFNHKVALVQR